MIIVVPGKVDTKVTRARPVLGDGVVFEEGITQMVSVAADNIFDAKNVDNEGKHNGVPSVLP